MFLIVEKLQDDTNHIILGPMSWRPTFFQNVLLDDLEIKFNVPLSNDKNELIIVSDTVKIYPVRTDLGVVGDFNEKIHHTNGPFYNFYEDYVEIYHIPRPKEIETIKSELKNIVANNRWKYEVKGISHTIQGQEVKLITNRGERDLYLQAYQLGKDGINWKFGDTFLTLSNTELGDIVTAVTTHIQSVFDWEAEKNVEIDSKETAEELIGISLVSDNINWESQTFNPELIRPPIPDLTLQG